MNLQDNGTRTDELSRGDFVRITQQNRIPRYKPGDRGMITQGPNNLGGGQRYYLVIMECDNPLCTVIFTEDEIERDSSTRVACCTQ